MLEGSEKAADSRTLIVKRREYDDPRAPWFRQVSRPGRPAEAVFPPLPGALIVGELRYPVELSGFRVREVVLATTPRDVEIPPTVALQDTCGLFRTIETSFRHLTKTTKIESRPGKTVVGSPQESTMFVSAQG